MTLDLVATSTYTNLIMDQAPRILSLMDRDPYSPTAGCCDRTYWAWKFVDFPGARFQEALCVLGYLYATPHPGSTYYRNPHLLRWIEYGLRYWTRIQYPDGSFDEAYPFERSLAATAFTSFYIAEALHFLDGHLAKPTRQAVIQSLHQAGRWLAHNDETHGFLSNHLAAAAAALQHIYHFTDDQAYARRSQYFIERILAHQSAEGWYEEYGGADPGYQTHGSFYLARLWQLTGNPEILESLKLANAFLAHFIHPDGSLGGEYASRNTQTYYPAAFEMLATVDATAAWIAETMRPVVPSATAVGLKSIDRYNYFPFLNNLVFACLNHTPHAQGGPSPPEPEFSHGMTWFPQAGFAVMRTHRYVAYVGITKGGVTKVFDRHTQTLVFSDCGYIGRTSQGKLISSQYQDPLRERRVGEDSAQVQGSFYEITRPTMDPWRFLAFRLFSLTLGRMATLSRWLKKLLVRALIYRAHPVAIQFCRTIQFDDNRVAIKDQIQGSQTLTLQELAWLPIFTTIHMGSSRYFIDNEITLPYDPGQVEDKRVDVQLLPSGIQLERQVEFEELS